MIIVANIETGKIFEREATPEELKQFAIDASERNLAKEQKLAEEAKKAEAKAILLARLGITEEEARLLLGGN